MRIDGDRQRFKDIGEGSQRGIDRLQQRDITSRSELTGDIAEYPQHREEEQQFLGRQEGA